MVELNFTHIITEEENKKLNLCIYKQVYFKNKGLITRSEAHFVISNYIHTNFNKHIAYEIFTNSYDCIINLLDYKEVI